MLNRIDLVNPSERELVLEEAHRIFGNVFCYIVAFSAKQALLSIESGDTEGLRQSGYFVLLESIEKNFLSKALHLQKKSKLLGFKGFTSEVVRTTDEYQKRLENDEKRRANLFSAFLSILLSVTFIGALSTLLPIGLIVGTIFALFNKFSGKEKDIDLSMSIDVENVRRRFVTEFLEPQVIPQIKNLSEKLIEKRFEQIFTESFKGYTREKLKPFFAGAERIRGKGRRYFGKS